MEGDRYSQTAGMLQGNKFVWKNTMGSEDTETDVLKTVLPKSAQR